MTQRTQTKYLHEGAYVAEMEIELTDSDIPVGLPQCRLKRLINWIMFGKHCVMVIFQQHPGMQSSMK